MITRDGYGIPAVVADSEEQAWFELGRACAEDRLWQLEYDRRRARGRLAEVVGAGALPADRLARRLRLTDAADNDVAAMDARTLATFEQYAAGINSYVAEHGTPAEFERGGIGWEPWTPQDSVLAFKIRHVLMGVWQYKIARAVLRARAGAEAAAKLDPRPLPGMRVTVPPLDRIPDSDPRAELLERARADVEAAAGHLGFLAESEGGSNAWVLGASRTATGKPLLANDSHRALDAPNTYWQARLTCPAFTVSGATFPGIPGFPHFGHNGRVGWAITNAAGDAQDLFVEQFRGERVRTADGWRPASVRDERIRVRGGEDHVERCWLTPNGPVVHGDPRDGAALSMRWTATDGPCEQFGVLRRMLLADSVHALLDAQDGWVDPLNNLVAADVDGHIGYLLRGRLPARGSLAATQVPVPGWQREHHWRGLVPFAEMPRTEDPPEDIIVTANNTVTADERPFVSHARNDCYRVERIHELAAASGPATLADMRTWQGDTRSVAARRWAELLAGRGPFSGEAEKARAVLVAGEGDLGPSSETGLVHACFRREVAQRVLDRELGEGTRSWLMTCGLPGMPVVLRRWFATLTWPRDGVWPAQELDDDLLVDALAAGWQRATEAGLVPWGEVHATAARHPLHPVVGTEFDPPQAGIGGDNETIQNGAYGWSPGASFDITNLSVYRQVLDLAELGASGWVVPGGASGRPGTDHYADQLGVWQRHGLVPMHPEVTRAGE
ncbi:penicillin acylase family protein [Amycolatopsis acidiphila]|uniref:penicillin acylase family protein n=1 Tax=Amycolatopsis acidiphila TaxID=715473 RepID=UPI001643B03C|nr:penicillin acylase family protein [Amycolatopsis acidiphila]UIJ63726.1 penicillin acylase family protein [Amycolatopsis acidiphila]GHG67184.1 peptidase S45 [Amycolatopsis acidiphila]